ncbi:GrpE protein [Thermodesulfatator indicus DSM 15286]|uniref:Protein GrpE n=1 Tax=Thermodesulfatator indicus (strain DSM 15286 / JCM 11887 / CIR29812) TaxID=667014 RepID=F8A8I6_THEID|nr:nucleotide exchange factor GrpE [Thermodesulfatator indicus]AEH45072.1 GrpE protein [Thermodesulfatator indicus DSM 15286]
MGKVYHLYRGGVPAKKEKEGTKVMEKAREEAQEMQETQETYPENRDELIELIKKKEAEAKEYKEMALRYAAEVENLKKSFKREKEEYFKYALETFMKELLPFVDNLERALEAAKQSQDAKALIEGIELTLKGLFQTLEKFGLKQFEVAIGDAFKPEIHEALAVEETHEHPEGAIVRTFQKGYTLHGRVIRPALVAVAKKPAEQKKETPEQGENKN